MRIILFLNLLGAVFTLLLSSSAVSSSSSNSTNVSSIVNQENAQYILDRLESEQILSMKFNFPRLIREI